MAANGTGALAANLNQLIATVPAGHVWIVKSVNIDIVATLLHTNAQVFGRGGGVSPDVAITTYSFSATGDIQTPTYNLFFVLYAGDQIYIRSDQATTATRWWISGEDLVQF